MSILTGVIETGTSIYENLSAGLAPAKDRSKDPPAGIDHRISVLETKISEDESAMLDLEDDKFSMQKELIRPRLKRMKEQLEELKAEQNRQNMM